jgi:hypothetical protein
MSGDSAALMGTTSAESQLFSSDVVEPTIDEAKAPMDRSASLNAGLRVARAIATERDGTSFPQLLKARFSAAGGGRYGAAHDYRGLVGQKNAYIARYTAALSKATAYVSSKIAELVPKEDQFEIRESEIATTFLAEGGDAILARRDDQVTAPGMNSLNVFFTTRDTLIEQPELPAAQRGELLASLKQLEKYDLAALMPWVHPSVMKSPTEASDAARFSLENALYAVAAGYASCKARAAADYRALKRRRFGALDAATQLFWVTPYFSGGAALGRKLLAAHDSPEDRSWGTRPTEFSNERGTYPSYYGNPYFYGLQRAASMELLDPEASRRKEASDART